MKSGRSSTAAAGAPAPPPQTRIPKKEVWEFKECFDWFDKEHVGHIKGADLPNALRAMGQQYSFADVQELAKEFKPEQSIDFPLFLSIAERRWGYGPNTEKLSQAFETLDRLKSGRVFVGDVKHLLTSVGEKLTEAEFKELCAINNFVYKGGDQTFDKAAFMRFFGAALGRSEAAAGQG